MHRGRASSRVAAVLDVVMHEKGVVQHFYAGCRGKCVRGAATKRACGRDAERRPQALARSADKILPQPIQVPLRFPGRYSARERVSEHLAVPAQAFQEARRSSIDGP